MLALGTSPICGRWMKRLNSSAAAWDSRSRKTCRGTGSSADDGDVASACCGGEAEDRPTSMHSQAGKGKGCCRWQSSVRRTLCASAAYQNMPHSHYCALASYTHELMSIASLPAFGGFVMSPGAEIVLPPGGRVKPSRPAGVAVLATREPGMGLVRFPRPDADYPPMLFRACVCACRRDCSILHKTWQYQLQTG